MTSLAVLLLASLTHTAARCLSDDDCNLNGVCTAGECVCVSFWGGADCGVVQFKPANATTRGALLPAKNTSHWCAGVLSDANGTWHLYSALMANSCGLSTWQSNSVITHATAMSPEGPFTAETEIMGWFAHNPKPARAPDGTWLVFHIGCGGNEGTARNCTNGTTPRSSGAVSPLAAVSNCSAYGTSVLAATSPGGPWTEQTVISPESKPFPASVDNPSPLIFENGTIWVMFRSYNGTGADRSVIGMARADSWSGPYVVDPQPLMPQVRPWMHLECPGFGLAFVKLSKLPPHPAIWSQEFEDPFLWWQPETRSFHALFHTMGGCRYVRVYTACIPILAVPNGPIPSVMQRRRLSCLLPRWVHLDRLNDTSIRFQYPL